MTTDKNFRIIHRYDNVDQSRVYVQERVGWWIFKLWVGHNNDNSRYHFDRNFRTIEEAKAYIINYRYRKSVKKFKEIIYL